MSWTFHSRGIVVFYNLISFKGSSNRLSHSSTPPTSNFSLQTFIRISWRACLNYGFQKMTKDYDSVCLGWGSRICILGHVKHVVNSVYVLIITCMGYTTLKSQSMYFLFIGLSALNSMLFLLSIQIHCGHIDMIIVL